MLKLAHRFVRRFAPSLYNPLVKVYSRYFDFDTKRLNRCIKKKLKALPDNAIFVSVGTNDGFSNDPFVDWVLTSNCHAFFIEPVPDVFARLCRNYETKVQSSDRLTFHNIALSSQNGIAPFFAVSAEAKSALGDVVPEWIDQLGSFNRSHIIKHLDGMLEPYIYQFDIPAQTLESYIESNDLKQIDVLHIDAEGHDYQIFSTLNLNKVRPSMILIEHKHLVAREKTLLIATLEHHGFEIMEFRSDLLALTTP